MKIDEDKQYLQFHHLDNSLGPTKTLIFTVDLAEGS